MFSNFTRFLFPVECSDKGLCWRENRRETSAKTSVCRPHCALTPWPSVSPCYHSSNDTSQWSCAAESQGQPGLHWGRLSWAALLNTVVLVSVPRTAAHSHFTFSTMDRPHYKFKTWLMLVISECLNTEKNPIYFIMKKTYFNCRTFDSSTTAAWT